MDRIVYGLYLWIGIRLTIPIYPILLLIYPSFEEGEWRTLLRQILISQRHFIKVKKEICSGKNILNRMSLRV